MHTNMYDTRNPYAKCHLAEGYVKPLNNSCTAGIKRNTVMTANATLSLSLTASAFLPRYSSAAATRTGAA